MAKTSVSRPVQRRRSRAEWTELVRALEASGLSVGRFAYPFRQPSSVLDLASVVDGAHGKKAAYESLTLGVEEARLGLARERAVAP